MGKQAPASCKLGDRPEHAHEIGMPGAYDQGWQRISWAGHLLTNWCGDRGFVRRARRLKRVPEVMVPGA